MREAAFLYHESCPKCGSRDNLGVWDDGHKWCFGCHYFVPANTTMESFVPKENNKNNDKSLPSDASYLIPPEPLRWLRSYGITNDEINRQQLMWSGSKEMLIFPYFGEEHELLFWQGRFFPTRKPKTITYGFPDKCLTLLGSSDSSRVVVCEDAVSHIKLARHVVAHCLFGSNLSLAQATRLSRMFDVLYIWLDQDKTKEAMKLANRYRLLFKEVVVISTELDPKEVDDILIKEKLDGTV